jgi:hypothetical protein
LKNIDNDLREKKSLALTPLFSSSFHGLYFLFSFVVVTCVYTKRVKRNITTTQKASINAIESSQNKEEVKYSIMSAAYQQQQQQQQEQANPYIRPIQPPSPPEQREQPAAAAVASGIVNSTK